MKLVLLFMIDGAVAASVAYLFDFGGACAVLSGMYLARAFSGWRGRPVI